METLTLTRKILRSAKVPHGEAVGWMLNISPKTVFKLAKAGRIPSFRVGSAVRFDARHIIDWLRKQRR